MEVNQHMRMPLQIGHRQPEHRPWLTGLLTLSRQGKSVGGPLTSRKEIGARKGLTIRPKDRIIACRDWHTGIILLSGLPTITAWKIGNLRPFVNPFVVWGSFTLPPNEEDISEKFYVQPNLTMSRYDRQITDS
jgi:hypothetical protein